LDISDFINHSEPELIKNIALMLEKSLNDKMLLTEEEKKELQAIIETSKVLEEMIYKFSN